VPKCGTGSLMKIIVWGEKCVCGSERKKDTMSLAPCGSVRGGRVSASSCTKDALRVHDKLCCRRR
jgi:hypothetical protein